MCLAVPADRARILDVLPRLSRSWAGSISAAVLTVLSMQTEERDFSRAALTAAGACAAHRITVTLADGARHTRPPKLRFPLNLLRNLAVRACSDPFVLMLDADLEVFPPLSASLLNRTAVQLLGPAANRTHVAIVLPAFAVHAGMLATWRQRDARGAPYAHKQQLLGLYETGLATPFNSDIYPRGERASDYAKWFARSEPEPYRVVYESGYEPYVLMRADDARATPYDTRFVGYGYDRHAHIEELHARGFALEVSPELFVVHTHEHAQVNAEHEPKEKGASGAGPGQVNISVSHATERCTGGPAWLRFRRNFVGVGCSGDFYRKLLLKYGYKVAHTRPLRRRAARGARAHARPPARVRPRPLARASCKSSTTSACSTRRVIAHSSAWAAASRASSPSCSRRRALRFCFRVGRAGCAGSTAACRGRAWESTTRTRSTAMQSSTPSGWRVLAGPPTRCHAARRRRVSGLAHEPASRGTQPSHSLQELRDLRVVTTDGERRVRCSCSPCLLCQRHRMHMPRSFNLPCRAARRPPVSVVSIKAPRPVPRARPVCRRASLVSPSRSLDLHLKESRSLAVPAVPAVPAVIALPSDRAARSPSLCMEKYFALGWEVHSRSQHPLETGGLRTVDEFMLAVLLGMSAVVAPTTRTFFAACPRGLEPALARELAGTFVGASNIELARNGVWFDGGRKTGMAAVLWSRTANRVMELLSSARAAPTGGSPTGWFTKERLYDFARDSVDWPSLLAPEPCGVRSIEECTVACEATVGDVDRSISNSHFTALELKNALVDEFRDRTGGLRPSVDVANPHLPLQMHVHRDAAWLFRVLSPFGSLHRRGYREAMHIAVLRENLAAGLLLETGLGLETAGLDAGPAPIDPDGAVLCDPMCGSATLAVEAALIATRTAPGLLRWGDASRARPHGARAPDAPPFFFWADYDRAEWRQLLREAEAARRPLRMRIHLADAHAGALSLAHDAFERIGHGRSPITYTHASIDTYRPLEPPTLIVANPPWGRRIGGARRVAGGGVPDRSGTLERRGRRGAGELAPDERDAYGMSEGVAEGSVDMSDRPDGAGDGAGASDDDVAEAWSGLGRFAKGATSADGEGVQLWTLSGASDLTKHLRMKASRKLPIAHGGVDLRWIKYDVLPPRREWLGADGRRAFGDGGSEQPADAARRPAKGR